MDNSADQSPTPRFPSVVIPGWEVHRRLDRPAIAPWPARRQLLLAPTAATSAKALLRIDLYEATGVGGVERVLALLVGEIHAREAGTVKAQPTSDGGLRWQWRGITIVGRHGVVAQLCNAGDETRDLSSASDAIEAALSQLK